jgi:sulfhydrogenase subunit delta
MLELQPYQNYAWCIKLSKPKVAIHSLTGCAGCQLSIYFIPDYLLELLSKIDLVAAPMIQSKNSEGPYDILFLEGSVSSEDDLKRLIELRKKSKVVIALGSCASFGNVQSSLKFNKNSAKSPLKIYKDIEHLKIIESSEIGAHVEVDYFLPGCPPDKNEILRFVKDLLVDKKPKAYTKPVCYSCLLKENECLLDQGRECLGPLTNGACDALCPSNNHSCTGCRGPLEDINYEAHKKLMKDIGVNSNLFKQRLMKYAPKEYVKIIKKL